MKCKLKISSRIYNTLLIPHKSSVQSIEIIGLLLVLSEILIRGTVETKLTDSGSKMNVARWRSHIQLNPGKSLLSLLYFLLTTAEIDIYFNYKSRYLDTNK